MTAPPELVVTGIGATLPPDTGGGPGDDWFDYRAELGATGYKYVPRAAQMLLAAANRAFDDAGRTPEAGDEGCGVVLASNNCASRLHASIDRTVVSKGVTVLRPATAPFFSINLLLSRLTIEYGLKGFCLALHTPRVAGMEAFEAGARAVRFGRASSLLLGVTEDLLDDVEPQAAESDEGAVVLTAQPADRTPAAARTYGTCVVRSLFVSPSAAADGSARVAAGMSAALAAVGAASPGALPVLLVGDDSPVCDAVATALGEHVRRVVAGPGALRPLTEVAALLRGGGPETVVVSATATGNVAVAKVAPH